MRRVLPGIVLTLALPGCGDGETSTTVSADVTALRARVACIERTTQLEPYLARIETLVRGTAPTAWVEAAGGPYKAATLRAFRTWHEAAEGRALPRAVDFEAEGHPLHAILDTARQLEAHGIDLLFVPVPDRVHVHPEEILGSGPIAGFCGMYPGTARLLVRLAEEGVDCVDLFELFARERALDGESEPLCQRNNRHWTPFGARRAAQVVAERLAAYDWFEPGPAHEGRDFELKRRRIPYTPPLDAAPDATPERLRFESVLVKGGEGELPEVDRKSPIVLLSDSFGASFRSAHAGFESHLYRYTGYRIDSINNVGVEGGSTTVRKKLRRRRGEGMQEKRVVVWLVGAATLASDKPWPKVGLFPNDNGTGR